MYSDRFQLDLLWYHFSIYTRINHYVVHLKSMYVNYTQKILKELIQLD